MGCRVQKASTGASKPVCKADACIRWYAHSHHFLDIRGAEILGGLACVAPRDGKIDARVQSAIQEGPDQRTAKLLYWSSSALCVPVDSIASSTERLRTHILDLSFGLQVKGKFFDCSQEIEDRSWCLWGRISGVEIPGIGLGKTCLERPQCKVAAHRDGHEAEAAWSLVKLKTSIRINLGKLRAAGHMALGKSHVRFVNRLAGHELI